MKDFVYELPHKFLKNDRKLGNIKKILKLDKKQSLVSILQFRNESLTQAVQRYAKANIKVSYSSPILLFFSIFPKYSVWD